MSPLESRIIAAPSPLHGNQLLQHCQASLHSRQLALPTIPEVSANIRRLINDEKSHNAKIARIVQIDPAITARLIQIANSPLFRARKPIESCPEAITRLGLKTTQNIVSVLAMKSVFNAKSPLISKKMVNLWKHSSYVAAISAVIASKIPGFDPDRAMLAGLIHDIGRVPILIYADQHLDMMARSSDLAETLRCLSAEIGVEIIRQWDFPADFEEVVINAENWYRNDARPPNYSDLITIAQLHSFIGTNDMKTLPIISELPIYQKMAGHLNASDCVSILDNAKNEIEAVWSMLD